MARLVETHVPELFWAHQVRQYLPDGVRPTEMGDVVRPLYPTLDQVDASVGTPGAGQSLATFFESFRAGMVTTYPERVLAALLPLLQELNAADVAHRDVTPSNVMWTHGPESHQLTISLVNWRLAMHVWPTHTALVTRGPWVEDVYVPPDCGLFAGLTVISPEGLLLVQTRLHSKVQNLSSAELVPDPARVLPWLHTYQNWSTLVYQAVINEYLSLDATVAHLAEHEAAAAWDVWGWGVLAWQFFWRCVEPRYRHHAGVSRAWSRLLVTALHPHPGWRTWAAVQGPFRAVREVMSAAWQQGRATATA